MLFIQFQQSFFILPPIWTCCFMLLSPSSHVRVFALSPLGPLCLKCQTRPHTTLQPLSLSKYGTLLSLYCMLWACSVYRVFTCICCHGSHLNLHSGGQGTVPKARGSRWNCHTWIWVWLLQGVHILMSTWVDQLSWLGILRSLAVPKSPKSPSLWETFRFMYIFLCNCKAAGYFFEITAYVAIPVGRNK